METVRRACPFIEWGVAGVPVHGEVQSGDRGLVQAVTRGALVAVVDGLGHGDAAAAAAARAVDTLRGHGDEALISLLHRCHEATRGTRGVAIGLAMINETRGTLTWLGVGDVAGVVMSRAGEYPPVRQPLFQSAGIVGARLPPLAEAIVPLRPRDLLIVATDGIRRTAEWQIIATAPPQSIADRILAEYRKETDDALVLVLRYLGHEARS